MTAALAIHAALGLRARAVLVALLALPFAVAARADEPTSIPDPGQLGMMRDAVRRAPVLIARGDFGLREFHHPWLDSSGVRSTREESPRGPRPALFATADAPPPAPAAAIPWSQITSLETQRPRKLQGAVAGFVIGLAVGGTLASTYEAKNSEDWTGVGLLLGTPMLGVISGTLLGSLSGTKVIYRAPTQENP